MYFEAQIKKILACDFGPSERFSVDNLHNAAMGFHSVLPKTEKEIDKPHLAPTQFYTESKVVFSWSGWWQ